MAYISYAIRVFAYSVVIILLLGITFPINGQTQLEVDSKTSAEFGKIGQRIDREIKGLESHSYKIDLKAGQYLKILTQTEKLAAEISLIAPSGENVFRLETENKQLQKEVLEIVAKTTGSYQLEVNSLEDITSPILYHIEIKEIRQALLKDKNRCIARGLTEQANLLQKIGTKEGFQTSVDRYLSALKYWRKSGDEAAIADVFRRLGENYYLLSNYQESLEYFTKELNYRKTTNDISRQARSVKNLGVVAYSMGDEEQALNYYNQALELGKESNNKSVIAQTLSFLATFYKNQGATKKAIDYSKQSLDVWQELDEPEEIIKITEELAGNYYSLAEIKSSLNYYEKTLIASRTQVNKPLEASLLTSIANIYDDLNDFTSAINYYEQALVLWGSLRKEDKIAEVLNNLGEIYHRSGDTTKALNSLEAALELTERKQDKIRQAQILNNLATVYRDSGEGRKAIDMYSDVFTLLKQNNDIVSTVSTAIDVGQTHLDLGDGDKAAGFFTEAYKLNQRKGNRELEAKIFYHLGRALEFNYEEEKAIASYKEGIIVAKELQDELMQAQLLYKLALLEYRRGELKDGKENIAKAIQLVENLQNASINQELQFGYSTKVADYYNLYINLLMQQHKLDPKLDKNIEALKVNEQARAHSLLNLLNTKDNKFSPSNNLVFQEHELKQLISDKTARLIKLNIIESPIIEVKEAEKEIETLAKELKERQTQIQQNNPHYAEFSQPKPFDIKAVQQQILDDNTVILEYSLGAYNSYLWLISQTEVKSFTLPKRSEIENLANYWRELMIARSLLGKGKTIGARPMTLELADSEYPKIASQLSKILLSPVAELLGKKRLVFVLDGSLQYIPFNALPEPNQVSDQPLLLNHEIVYLPSIATLSTLRHEAKDPKQNTKSVMLIGDPIFSSNDSRVKSKDTSSKALKELKELKELTNNNLLMKKSAQQVGVIGSNSEIARLSISNEETKELSALAGEGKSKQLLGSDASLKFLSNNRISDYQVIHFSTYGLANSSNPELSGIMLSSVDEQGNLQDGFLQTHKIFNLNLPVDLVTLSACEATVSKNAQAEGLLGLTRGFMYAGASRVMVSLWNVNDSANTELMKKFYQKVLKEGQTPTAALRAAQLEMRQDEKYKNPFYWAAFQLQGEWK